MSEPSAVPSVENGSKYSATAVSELNGRNPLLTCTQVTTVLMTTACVLHMDNSTRAGQMWTFSAHLPPQRTQGSLTLTLVLCGLYLGLKNSCIPCIRDSTGFQWPSRWPDFNGCPTPTGGDQPNGILQSVIQVTPKEPAHCWHVSEISVAQVSWAEKDYRDSHERGKGIQTGAVRSV